VPEIVDVEVEEWKPKKKRFWSKKSKRRPQWRQSPEPEEEQPSSESSDDARPRPVEEIFGAKKLATWSDAKTSEDEAGHGEGEAEKTRCLSGLPDFYWYKIHKREKYTKIP
jgi:hypothetical protein